MIYTSCYAVHGKNPTAISIARRPPDWYRGETYTILAPTKEIFAHWLDFHNEEFYTKEYNRLVLDKLDPHEVLKMVDERIMLCWERADRFCHRHIVAKWLNQHTKCGYHELT